MLNSNNKRNLARVISALLIAASLAVLPSCGNSSGSTDAAAPQTENTAAENTETTAAETEPTKFSGLNYEAQTVNVLGRTKEYAIDELTVESQNGEVMNDSVYNRNINVTSQLNVNLTYVQMNDSEFNDSVKNTILAGDNTYQYCGGSATYMVYGGAEGYYRNLTKPEFEYLDITADYWYQDWIKNATIGNKLFFITGDYSLTLKKLSWVALFNKKIINDYGFDNPYTLVNDGVWTIDKLNTMVEAVYTDLNGDGSAKFADDLFGYVGDNCISSDAWGSAFNLTSVKRDENNIPYFSIDQEKFQLYFDKIRQLFYHNAGSTIIDEGAADSGQVDIANKFAAGQIAFITTRMYQVELLRDMQDDFGIIPLPKLTEQQEQYKTYVHDGYTIFFVPNTVPDNDISMVSAVLEAMCIESSKEVLPAYYDIVMNGKYLRDEESSKMLDMAVENVYIDFLWIYTGNLNYAGQDIYRYQTNKPVTTSVSKLLESRQKRYDAGLADLVVLFDNLPE